MTSTKPLSRISHGGVARRHEDLARHTGPHVLHIRGAVVEEQRRDREGERHHVPGTDEQALEPVGDPTGRVRERDVREQCGAEPAKREADGERDAVVAVLPRADQPREAEARPSAAPGGSPGAATRRPGPRRCRRGPLRAPGASGARSGARSSRSRRVGGGGEHQADPEQREPEQPHVCRSRSAERLSPASSSFGMNPAAPQRRARRPISAGSRLETSTTRVPPPIRSLTSKPLMSGSPTSTSTRSGRSRSTSAPPMRRPMPHRPRRTPRARAVFGPSGGTARGRRR